MVRRPFLRLASLATFSVVVGCALGPEPGSFTVRFEFRDGAPASDTELYAFARVQRSTAQRSVVTVAEATPMKFEPGVRLAFDKVPNGTNYTVVTELRASRDDSARVEYFGRSEPFDLLSGESVTVDVELDLQPVPEAIPGSAPVRVVEAHEFDNLGRYVRQREVTLALVPSGATRIVVANDARFKRGVRTRELSELESRGDEFWWSGWDLDDEVCDERPCEDGPREIHVEFENDSGYGSGAFETDVILDTRPPGVSNYRRDPETATDGDIASLLLISRENLRTPPEIRVDPADFSMELVSERSDPGPGVSFTYQYVVDDRAVDGAAYSLTAKSIDLAGNEAEEALPAARLTIAGDLAAVSAAIERTPSFKPFERTRFLSRTDPVTGAPITITVRVTSNIPFSTATPPSLRAESGKNRVFDLRFEPADSSDKQAVFRYTISDSVRAGSYGLRLDWKDRAGRRGKPELELKIELRDAPASTVFGRLDVGVDANGNPQTLHVSRAWGAQTMGGYKALGDTVTGRVIQRATNAEDCIDQVLIYGDADASGNPRAASLLAIADMNGATAGCPESSTFEVGFSPRSGPKLYAVLVTASGYVGPPQPIVHGEWVATLAPEAQGGESDSPHALLAHLRLPATPTELAESKALPVKSTDSAYRATWSFTPSAASTAAPRAFDLFAATYDPNHGKVILLASTDEERTQVWEFDGVARAVPSAAASPLAWSSFVAYDGARDRLVLFGGGKAKSTRDGENGATGEVVDNNETWEWDGTSWSLREPAHKPPTDAGGLMVYDSARQRVVMVSCEGDGWEWDGHDWSNVADIPVGDECVSALVYDSERRVIVAVATDYESNFVTFESEAGDWQRRGSTSLLTANLSAFKFAYDASTRRAILSIGEYSDYGVRETWQWDGSAWTLLSSTNLGGPNGPLIFDAKSGSLLAFSGHPTLSNLSRLEGSRWVTQTRDNNPPARADHGMTYDVARNRIVLFGGDTKNTSAEDTWENEGGYWIQREVSVDRRVGGSSKLGLVYDAARRVSLLLSPYDLFEQEGISGTEMFAYDGTAWSLVATELSMPARSDHALAYDAARERVVLFGGTQDASDDAWRPLGDTWEWNGEQWSQIPTEGNPPARSQHAMAPGVPAGRVLLFGGVAAVDGAEPDTFVENTLNDSWEWDGSRWRELSPTSVPTQRCRHAMAYDEARQRVVLFGGRRESFDGDALNDTWEWDGSSWIQIVPLNSPSARFGHDLTYDASTQKVVLFGGQQTSEGYELRNDLWEWDGSNWTERSVNNSPRMQRGFSLAYDARNQRVALFGGEGDWGNSLRSDLWAWDGRAWGLQTPASRPAARSGASMAFDATRGGILMFGGANYPNVFTDTWLWDGVGWQMLDQGGVRADVHALLHDERLGTSVLATTTDTYRLEDDQWRPIVGAGGVTGAEYIEDFVYDRDREMGLALVPVPGRDMSQLWEWDGATWSMARDIDWLGGITHDPRSESTLFVSMDGAYQFSTHAQSRVWKLAAGGLEELETLSAPEGVLGKLAYDEAREQVVLFGSVSMDLEANTGTWLLSKVEPAHQLTIDLTPLVGADRARDVQLDELALRAVAGADGSSDGSPVAGVVLDVWNGLAFESVLEHDAPFDSPSSLCFQSADAGTLGRLEADNTWHFVLHPRGGQGSWSEPPRLQTSSFEVRVRYHFAGAEPAVPHISDAVSGPCDELGWSSRDWLRME